MSAEYREVPLAAGLQSQCGRNPLLARCDVVSAKSALCDGLTTTSAYLDPNKEYRSRAWVRGSLWALPKQPAFQCETAPLQPLPWLANRRWKRVQNAGKFSYPPSCCIIRSGYQSSCDGCLRWQMSGGFIAIGRHVPSDQPLDQSQLVGSQMLTPPPKPGGSHRFFCSLKPRTVRGRIVVRHEHGGRYSSLMKSQIRRNSSSGWVASRS